LPPPPRLVRRTIISSIATYRRAGGDFKFARPAPP
jgi:hypothetical protein